MKFSAKKALIGVLIVMMVPFFCLAENKTENSFRLDDVVVSASRSEMPAFDTPQSVTVISDEEIMASPFDRVEDILRDVVGYVNHSHYGQQTGGVSSHFSIRGVGRNRTLLMVDGVPLNDNFSNTITWISWGLFPKEIIDRIEIVRGPTSAAYGSEGLGGVIHIITKKPSEKRETSAAFTYGSGETRKESALHSQKMDEFGFLLSGSYEDADGLYMADPEDVDEETMIRRYRHIKKIYGKATYDLGDKTDIDFSGIYYDQEMGKGKENFGDEALIDQYRLGITRRGVKSDWSGLVFLNQAYKTAFIQSSGILIRKEKFPRNRTYGAGLQNTTRLSESFIITSGIDYKRITMDYEEHYVDDPARDSQASGRQVSFAPFVDTTAYFLGDKLVFNAGLRYTNIKNYDGRSIDSDPPNTDPFDIKHETDTWDNFSPKAGVVFHPDNKTALRASFGQGFKAPSLFDLYKCHSRSTWSITLANPELGPEKITTWDVGVERHFFNRVLASIGYYNSRATDYIDTRIVDQYPRGSRTYTERIKDNLNKVDIQGAEAEIKYDFGHGLSSRLGYAYTLAKVAEDQTNASLKGKYLTTYYRHKYKAGLTYRNPSLINGSLSFRYNAHKYEDELNTETAPDYMNMDLSLWKKINKVTLRLNVENLTNENRYVGDGKLFYGSVKVDF